MNIEEVSLAEALRSAGQLLGHVHFVDSNRWAAGFGHTEMGPIIKALRDIGYDGYLTAEYWPYAHGPDVLLSHLSASMDAILALGAGDG